MLGVHLSTATDKEPPRAVAAFKWREDVCLENNVNNRFTQIRNKLSQKPTTCYNRLMASVLKAESLHRIPTLLQHYRRVRRGPNFPHKLLFINRVPYTAYNIISSPNYTHQSSGTLFIRCRQMGSKYSRYCSLVLSVGTAQLISGSQ